MNDFNDLLQLATPKIAEEFFRLPIHGSDEVYRERVYCYELYHQLRSIWPGDSRYPGIA